MKENNTDLQNGKHCLQSDVSRSYSMTSWQESEYSKEHKKLFCETLTKMTNEFVIPAFGMELTFNIQLGLWTSEEYGSYMISFYNNENKKVCYLIADTIQGRWECYNCV